MITLRIPTVMIRKTIKAVRDNRLYATPLSSDQLELIEKLLGTLLPKGKDDEIRTPSIP